MGFCREKVSLISSSGSIYPSLSLKSDCSSFFGFSTLVDLISSNRLMFGFRYSLSLPNSCYNDAAGPFQLKPSSFRTALVSATLIRTPHLTSILVSSEELN